MTTILVTGANRGIGLEFVQQYAVEGANIIACCREPAKATALKAIKGKVRVMALDVADPKSVEVLVCDLKGEPIDILINNAGVGGPRETPRGIIDMDGWLKIFAVNSIAPVMVAVALRDNLKAGHDKKLVTIQPTWLHRQPRRRRVSLSRVESCGEQLHARPVESLGERWRERRHFSSRLGSNRHGRQRCAGDTTAERDGPSRAHRRAERQTQRHLSRLREQGNSVVTGAG
jgi:NAD(P)-dependent dehydrogenase (short-subunit alcohol dehydrogenase family)